jgi:hypothetical protein
MLLKVINFFASTLRFGCWVDMPVKLTIACRSKLTTYFAGEDFKFKHCFGSLSNI